MAIMCTCPGSAYLFVRAGESWTQTSKIRAEDAETNSYFGYAVSIRESGMAVGAKMTDDGGVDTGTAAASCSGIS